MDAAELAAREAIRDLVARYAHAADRGRFDEVASLFAQDGVLELPDGTTSTGPAAVRSFLGGVGDRLRVGSAAPGLIRHHVSSHRIVVDGPDAAHGWAYFFVVTHLGPDHWGRYADHYVRRDDEWLFARRRVQV